MPSVNETLNGFRFINLLMTGQTSQVWQVMRDADHRDFALKLLLPQALRDDSHRKFLAHEADVGLQLTHPNVIRVIEYYPLKDNPHVVMEFFPSTNVKLRIIYKQDIVREKFAETARAVAEALGYLHRKGWVHRDVKPDNILLCNSGEVRLIDFALCEKILPGWRRHFVGKRQVMGTRSYMSPEQIRGKPLDPAADVYSLGVVFFEMLTGRVPFVADDPNRLLYRHIHDAPPSPQSFNPAITDEMTEVILTMLAKKPEDRYKDMTELQAQLQRAKPLKEE